MSWIDPLKRLLRPVEGRQAAPKPEEPEPAPLGFGIIAQSARILTRAHVYRQQMQREAEAREREREARERQERERRQMQWEDEVARSLALRWSHFPGDGDAERPAEVIPLEGGAGQAGGEGGPPYFWVRW